MKTQYLFFSLCLISLLTFTACQKNIENPDDNENNIQTEIEDSTNKDETDSDDIIKEEDANVDNTENNNETIVDVSDDKTEVSVKNIMDKILKHNKVSMYEASELELEQLYNLDDTTVKDFAIFMPVMNVNSSEYAVFEANSTKDVDKIVEGIKSRLATIEEIWKQYLPDQYELVQNYKILTHDNYVLFTISEISDYAENVFLRTFDPSIEEIVLKTTYKNVVGKLTEYTSESIVVEFIGNDGTTVVVKGTPSEAIYTEGEIKVDDSVNVSFEEDEEVNENGEIEAIITYMDNNIIYG